jgi:hypothetical protein
MRKTALLTLAFLTGAVLLAQEVPSDFHRLTLEEAFQQFQSTNNAAGMGLFQPLSGSRTQIETFYLSGDDHLSQEGSPDYGFDFSTLRYDRFSDKLFMRGSFHYSLDREKERKWSDVTDPWFSIPFIYGNAVAKDYDKHQCGLTLDLYTAPLAGWISVGLRTKYDVADISGLRDPRPRTGCLDYQLVPSALATFGAHHVGLDLGYGYSKEKLSGLTTIQSYPNLYYYKMTGLDHIDGAISAYSGFKRQFYGSRFLGDLQYSYAGGPWNVLASGGVEYKQLAAYGDKQQTVGTFDYWEYKGLASATYATGRLLHSLRVEGRIKDAGASEYLQELVAEKDPDTGVTTETWQTLYVYKDRYMLKTTSVEAAYKLYGGCAGNDYRWSVGAGAVLDGFVKTYYLPYSGFQSDALTVRLEGSFRLFQVKGHKVDLSAQGAFRKSLFTALSVYEENEYVTEVLRPDREYYAKDAIRFNGSLLWEFPLNLGKAGLASGYVRLDGGICRALPQGSLARVELSVGLFTF